VKQRPRDCTTAFRLSIYCFLLVVPVLLEMVAASPRAEADGGAPDLAYVAGAQQGVGVIDVAQQKVARDFAVGGDPYMILLSSDGRLLYVTQPAIGRVTALAARTGQVICSATFPGHPAFLAFNVDGTVLYVAGINETSILALDAETCAIQRTFQAPEPISWLASVGITTTSGFQMQLWVAGSSSVSIMDEQGRLLDSVIIPGGPRFLCLPSELTAYVATGQGQVVAVDMVTHQVFATLLSGGTFGSMDYDAVTGDIYVPDQRHNLVDVLSPVVDGSGAMPQEPERVYHLSGAPRAIAVTNDGSFGFVALDDSSVAMLGLPERQLLSTIHVGGAPRYVITGPYPPQDVPTPQPAQSSVTLWVIVLLLVAAAVLVAGVWVVVLVRWHRGRAKRL
jgi:DNA-binding beta-propeller fold protein YncE